MPNPPREQEPATPDQLIRMFRLRPRAGTRKKLRQVDLAKLIGIETRTLQLWESGERLPGADNLQRLIQVLLVEHLFLVGEEQSEARFLWETVSQAYDERPGTYRLYPPFDEHWFSRLLHTLSQETAEGQGMQPDLSTEENSARDQTTKHVAPTNLRAQPTSFIGRREALAEIKSLLTRYQLVTLTGPGGCGKTRLALRIGEDMLESYPQGVWLVELAALTEATLLPSLVATTLAFQEQSGQTLTETLSAALRGQRMLLILDNCEHLVEACATLVEYLHTTCPMLSILVTSREALNVAGESVWQLAPLSVPPLSPATLTIEQIRHAESVQLFLERARLFQPQWELTAENAPVIVSICQQLDGLPLALELAAARMNLLSLEQIAERLADRFRLLTAGRRTALPQHQTLRATLDWSYALLSEKEQVLFKSLSVFAGGCTLEAIETICSWDATETGLTSTVIEPEEVLDLLGQLVNKSLVQVASPAQRQNPYDPRYRLFETMKLYGQEQLETWKGRPNQEYLLLQKRHARYYLNLVEQADRRLRSNEREVWLARIRADYENLRSALSWSLTPQGDAVVGMRMAGVLYWFWLHEGAWSEGRAWLEKLLTKTWHDEESVYKARTMHGLGILLWVQGESTKAEQLAREAVVIARRNGKGAILASALRLLAQIELNQGELETAQKLAEESVQLAREQEDVWNLASSLSTLGTVMHAQRNDTQAWQLYKESLHAFEETGDRWEQTSPLRSLGQLALARGDYQQATDFYTKSIVLCQGMRGTWFLTRGLEGLARVVCAQRDFLRSATLLGAAEGQRSALGAVVMPIVRSDYDQTISLLQKALSLPAFEEAWHKGKSMSTEQSIRYALENGTATRTKTNRPGEPTPL